MAMQIKLIVVVVVAVGSFYTFLPAYIKLNLLQGAFNNNNNDLFLISVPIYVHGIT